MRAARSIIVRNSGRFLIFISVIAFSMANSAGAAVVGMWPRSFSVQSAVRHFDQELNRALEQKTQLKNYRDPILSMNYARLVAFHELEGGVTSTSVGEKTGAAAITMRSMMESWADAIHTSLKIKRQLFYMASPTSHIPLTLTRFFPTVGPQGNIFGDEFPTGTWALTFDDGPLPRYSSIVLRNLQEHGMKATFCEVAQMAEDYPTMAKQIHDAGMGMCNHSFTHADLAKATPAQLVHEIVDSTQLLTAIWGEAPRFFRLPYGAGLYDKAVRSLIAKQGMISLYWNVDSLDWADKNPESILARVSKEMALHRAGVVLFHDIHPQSVAASKLVMDKFSKVFRWVTVPEIVNQMNRATGNF